jgi:hypothetical protein
LEGEKSRVKFGVAVMWDWVGSGSGSGERDDGEEGFDEWGECMEQGRVAFFWRELGAQGVELLWPI